MNDYKWCGSSASHSPHEWPSSHGMSKCRGYVNGHGPLGMIHDDMNPTPEATPRYQHSSILDEAGRLVDEGERQQEYGPPEESFTEIAAYWSTYLGVELKPLDVPAMMILLKLARGLEKRDTLVDIAGYARCAERLNDGA